MRDTIARKYASRAIKSSQDLIAQYSSAANLGVGLVATTWTQLAAITPTVGNSAGAIVIDADTGTHTDPVVGGTVTNGGLYSYVTGSGWKRVASTVSQSAAGSAAAAASSANGAASVLASVPAAFDYALKADRNIFDKDRVNDNSQISAYGGSVGSGGVVSTLAGQFVTPIMEVTPGVTYSVNFNGTRGVFFNAAGQTINPMSLSSIDTYHFTFTVPTGQGITSCQIQGDKSYSFGYNKTDIHAGSRVKYKGFEGLEVNGATSVAMKAVKTGKATNDNLLTKSDVKYDYVVSTNGTLGTGAITASPGSNCWTTGLFRVDEVRGVVSSLSINIPTQGVAFYDVDKNYIFSNGDNFTGITTVGSNTINVTTTSTGRALLIGSVVYCDTANIVPAQSQTTGLYITGVPANGAPFGVYTLSGNVTDATGGTHADMHAGGMQPGVAVIPTPGYGIAYGAVTYFYYMNGYAYTLDNWVLTDGPFTAATTTSGTTASSVSLGLPDMEVLFPWYRVPMAVLGNSINAGQVGDYFASVTKADLKLLGAVPATQMHQNFDGCRIPNSGGNRNAVTGNITGAFTAADFAGIKGVLVGPCGGNEVGYNNGSNLGNSALGDHRTSYPLGTITDTAPVAVFAVTTTLSSSTINITSIESGSIVIGAAFPSTAPLGLVGKTIASQSSITTVTGATASFATNVMTVTVAGTGSFAVGQTVSAVGVPANTYISSLGTGTGGTGTYNLSTTPGTLTARATTATNAGGLGTYTLNNGTGVTAGSVYTIVGSFYGTLYWHCITKLGAFCPGAIPFLITTLPRWDLGSSNGGVNDPNNPGNPINAIALRLSDYIDATIAFGKKFHFPVIDMFYNTPFVTTGVSQMYNADGLHPFTQGSPSVPLTTGTHIYAGTVAANVNRYFPAV